MTSRWADQRIVIARDESAIRAVAAVSGEQVAASADAAAVLQQAVDAAGAHGAGIVQIEPGRYELARPVRLADRVSVRGFGRATRLDVTGPCGLIAETLDGAEVTDLMLSGGDAAEAGIVYDACGDSRITNVFAAGFARYGVQLRNHCFLSEVRNCQLAGNREANLFWTEAKKGRVGDYLPNLISGCTIYGGGEGIRCERVVVMNITGCAVFQTQGHGYHLKDSSNSIVISACRTFQVTGHAVLVEQTHELNVTGNIFCWHTGHGLLAQGCAWGVVSGNNFIDNGSYNPVAPDQARTFEQVGEIPRHSGVVLEGCCGVNVSSNAIFNWPQGTRMACGVIEDDASHDNLIACNNVNYCGPEAIRAAGRDTRVETNVSRTDEPHLLTSRYPYVQSFEPHRTQTFIDAQLRGGDPEA